MYHIVTGGAGYIGSHLAEDMVSRGDRVTVIDDLSSGTYMTEGARFVKVDLRDGAAVGKLDIDGGATIIHLAADPNVKESMEDVIGHFHKDVTATLNVLELARRHDAKAFVFASSSVVYGDARIIPTKESNLKRPISNYGTFKLMSEHLVEQYAVSYGIRSTALRLANVVGGRTSHGIIPDIIAKLRLNSSELEILGDGRQQKSYIYITDVISAINVVVQKPKEGFRALNVGSADSLTVKEMADIICEEMGIKPVYRYAGAHDGRGWKGDVKVMLLDTTGLRRLGWSPAMSSREAFRQAVRDLLAAKKKAPGR
ncbi:MAG: NAD-dependent epimerase/dehydratase family protein [Candidatus Marsarchaeota archaeon]|jgi:UDP-glucose 4-epimerase|nr:NAD-dependent epimerase/dehydratase family protein [Candidatus Marsarchaeota archaeon]